MSAAPRVRRLPVWLHSLARVDRVRRRKRRVRDENMKCSEIALSRAPATFSSQRLRSGGYACIKVSPPRAQIFTGGSAFCPHLERDASRNSLGLASSLSVVRSAPRSSRQRRGHFRRGGRRRASFGPPSPPPRAPAPRLASPAAPGDRCPRAFYNHRAPFLMPFSAPLSPPTGPCERCCRSGGP